MWLLAAGGTLYFAFPLLYASSFSGFYLPLMMAVVTDAAAHRHSVFIHIQEMAWKGFFDTIFGNLQHSAGNLLLAPLGNAESRCAAECRRILLRTAVDQLARGGAQNGILHCMA